METVLLVVHLLIALGLIGAVMLQRSEGGALGIGGGGGGAGNLFTSRGVGNALTRTTAYLAVGFFCTSIALTILATRKNGSVFDTAPAATGTKTEESVLPVLPDAPKPAVPVSQ
jgi:preprotein translocase subunit SecG